MALSRTSSQRLVANARVAETTTITLPALGEELLVRRPNNVEKVDIASSGGPDSAGALVRIVKAIAIDADSKTRQALFATEASAASFINLLDDSDLLALSEGIKALLIATEEGEGDPKASSPTTPAS